MKSVYGACFALALCLSFLATSFAADRSSLHGTIKDPLGAVVPNAHVSLIQNGKATATTTDGSGAYAFSSVPAGVTLSARKRLVFRHNKAM